MMIKKITALAFLLLLLGATEATFVDETEFPSWSDEAIEVVSDADIMTGFGDGSFRPRQNLNRAEAVTLLLRAKRLEQDKFNGVSKFADVPGEAWFARAVAAAENHGWLTGKADGRFHPGDTLNRAEFAALIDRAFDLDALNEDPLEFEDIVGDEWFYEPVKVLYDRELLRNARNNYFRPAQEVTRAEAAWVFAQILSKPGLNGTAGENDFSNIAQIDNRRVAIKPRDFNPNKQSVDVEQKELYLSGEPAEASDIKIIRGDENWTLVGSIRVENKLEASASLVSFNARLRFAENDVGPEENLEARLHGPRGFESIVPVVSGGNALFAGMDIDLAEGDQEVYWLSYRALGDQTYFPNTGSAMVTLNDADGLYYAPFVSDDPTRRSEVRPSPMGYGERLIGEFEFLLNAE